jgi:integrase
MLTAVASGTFVDDDGVTQEVIAGVTRWEKGDPDLRRPEVARLFGRGARSRPAAVRSRRPSASSAPRRRRERPEFPSWWSDVEPGVRRFELRALRWRDVSLSEGVLRVRVSKSEEGEHSIALAPTLVSTHEEHYRRTAFRGDGEFVFCHPKRGTSIGEEWFADRLRAALKAVGITERVRPFHDLRHTAITNDAAAGSSELAVMAKAGHRSMETTRQYLHLAGVVFRGEAEALEARVLGVESSTDLSEPQRTSAHTNPLRKR